MSDHVDQRVTAVRVSLTAAGIGSSYHERHLTDLAPDLVEPAKGPLLTAAREGRGITFVGAAAAYDEMVVLARAFHLQALPVKVVPLRRLAKWLDTDFAEQLNTVESAGALFVTGFYDDSVECPLTPWQLSSVEELLNDRIDNHGAFFPQVSRNLDRNSWWSDTLVRRIARLNTVRPVAE